MTIFRMNNWAEAPLKPKAPQPKAPKQLQPEPKAAKPLPMTIPMPKSAPQFATPEIDKELLDGIERRRMTLATTVRGVIDGDTMRSSSTGREVTENRN